MTLQTQYERHCQEPSDIFEHLPRLRSLAQECSSVVEIGVKEMVSTWGLLQGLAENASEDRSYLGIDLSYPPKETLQLADALATQAGIVFSFWKGNDMAIDVPKVDLLFIDSLHTYCHLTYELEKFAPQANKYIVLHDTSYPWESIDDNEYRGDYREYPAHISRAKRGLWAAVQDFLLTHTDWVLHERWTHCHGLTVLKRASREASRPMKILYTSALVPQKYEERKQEYIHSIEVLQAYGFLPNIHVVESGPPTIFSFFEEYCEQVFYAGTNDVKLRNKGVNEAKSLLHFCETQPIGDDEMVVKLTGRYAFTSDLFLRYVASDPKVDVVASPRERESWKEKGLQTGCFAMRGRYLKQWLASLDLEEMEAQMIDLEWAFTRYIESIIAQGAVVEVWDKIDLTAYISDGYYRYY